MKQHSREEKAPKPEVCITRRATRRRDNPFRVSQIRRVYDRTTDKFSFNISYETHTRPTPRSLVVAEAFGIGIDEGQKFTVIDAELTISKTDIV